MNRNLTSMPNEVILSILRKLTIKDLIRTYRAVRNENIRDLICSIYFKSVYLVTSEDWVDGDDAVLDKYVHADFFGFHIIDTFQKIEPKLGVSEAYENNIKKKYGIKEEVLNDEYYGDTTFSEGVLCVAPIKMLPQLITYRQHVVNLSINCQFNLKPAEIVHTNCHKNVLSNDELALNELFLRNSDGQTSTFYKLEVNCPYQDLAFFNSVKRVQTLKVNLSSENNVLANKMNISKLFLKLSIHDMEIYELFRNNNFNSKNLQYLNLKSYKMKELDGNQFKDFQNLKFLNLSNNHIESVKNVKDENFPKLIHLNLSKNKISNFEEIMELWKLKSLNCNDNNLSSIQNLSFKNLNILDLSGNSITKIESFSSNNTFVDLEVLNLANNRFKKMPVILLDLPKLKVLNIKNNYVTTIDNVENLNALKILNLNNNKLSNVTNKLDNLTNLKILKICTNNLIALHLTNNLIELKVSGNYLKLIDYFPNQANLLNLDLSNNSVSEISFLKPFTRLKILNLSNNDLVDFKSDLNLVELYLQNNKINDFECNSSKLKILNLNSNKLTSVRVIDFPNLQKLSVSHNKLIRIPNLSRNFGIIILDLSNNNINKLEFFQNLGLLKLLNMANNSLIQFEGLNCLNNSKLSNLNLSNNYLSILQNLAGFSNLHILDLSNNSLKTFDLEALHLNNNLKVVNLSNNKISKIENFEHNDNHVINDQIESLNLSDNMIELKTYNLAKIFSTNSFPNLSKLAAQSNISIGSPIVLSNNSSTASLMSMASNYTVLNNSSNNSDTNLQNWSSLVNASRNNSFLNTNNINNNNLHGLLLQHNSFNSASTASLNFWNTGYDLNTNGWTNVNNSFGMPSDRRSESNHQSDTNNSNHSNASYRSSSFINNRGSNINNQTTNVDPEDSSETEDTSDGGLII